MFQVVKVKNVSSDDDLIIWDSVGSVPEQVGTVYCWDGYAETCSARSLLRYIETHADRLRHVYLAFVHDAGVNRSRGGRVIEHLAFKDGLSFWWLTSIATKNLHQSPVTDALRFFALEEIVTKIKPKKIRLVSADRKKHKMFRNLCRSSVINYQWDKCQKQPFSVTREFIYRCLPHPLQALLTLVRQLKVGVSFKQLARPIWFKEDKAVFFCGYFANVVPDKAKKGRFHSLYWEDLHSLLRELKFSANWLHHNASPDSQTAIEWVRLFNRDNEKQGVHAFLNSYLSIRIVVRVILKWLWLNWISCRLGNISGLFRSKRRLFSLWPLFQKDWGSSLRGEAAITNLFSIELFDAAMRNLPYQKLGFYLCENNEWERALIHAWRKHGHGKLIAVPHATIRFWDLRYFFDKRTIHSSESFSMPQADSMALNGKAAVDMFLKAGYTHENIETCEALRFGYLNTSGRHQFGSRRRDVRQVLILGDILYYSTYKMLQMLKTSSVYINKNIIFTLKPHPLCPIKPEDFASLNLAIVKKPLGEIITEYDVVYTTNVTSASVDAYLAGLSVVVMLNDTELNFSPLRGKAGVSFVSTPKDLAEALHLLSMPNVKRKIQNDYFFLDSQFPKWKRLLLDT
jgi:surface carbohydrate biosynthesis protein (TIGR04326 family)